MLQPCKGCRQQTCQAAHSSEPNVCAGLQVAHLSMVSQPFNIGTDFMAALLGACACMNSAGWVRAYIECHTGNQPRLYYPAAARMHPLCIQMYNT